MNSLWFLGAVSIDFCCFKCVVVLKRDFEKTFHCCECKINKQRQLLIMHDYFVRPRLTWTSDWPEWHFWVLGLKVIQANPQSLRKNFPNFASQNYLRYLFFWGGGCFVCLLAYLSKVVIGKVAQSSLSRCCFMGFYFQWLYYPSNL